MEHLTEQQLQDLLRAPESRRLLELLQSSDGAALKKAAAAAKCGDHAKVEALLGQTLQSSQAQALMNQLQKQFG